MLCSTTNRLLPHRPLPPVSFAALCMLLVALVSCGGSASTTPTPTPVTIQFVTFNLGIPAQALNAPVVGPLPDNTRMHVVATFKANQALLNQLNKQKVKPGQSTDLKNLANQIGISSYFRQAVADKVCHPSTQRTEILYPVYFPHATEVCGRHASRHHRIG